MLGFTPLLGAQSQSPASQSLLELDGGVKILIDVGWDTSFDVEKLRSLEKQIPTISIILLTHATIPHLAAYAHCCKHFPLFTRIPVYATTPVISLGRTLLQDLYASTPLASTVIPPTALSEASFTYGHSATGIENAQILLPTPTPEEIVSYFSLIHPLKYSQPHQPLPSPFSPPLNGLTVTAYNAGHTLGGTIWHIQHGLESIVYAVDWNQTRENVLAGAAWLGGAGAGGTEVIEQLRRPTAMICSSRGAEKIALPGGTSKRDELLLDMIKSAVVKGGTVLIPTDSSARVLELAYILEHSWRREASIENSPLQKTKLYLASKNIGATLRYARSMLEWMDDEIIKEFEATAGGGQQRQSNETSDGKQSRDSGPFDFKFLRLLERKAQIDRFLKESNNEENRAFGNVILASDTSIEWGFSRDLLKGIAGDNRNLVILTDRSDGFEAVQGPPSLATQLSTLWKERKEGVAVERDSNGDILEQVYCGGQELDLKDLRRTALDDTDLLMYQQWLATQRQLQTTLQTGGATVLESSADVVDDASSESSSDTEGSETEHQGKALNISTTLGQANRKKIGLSDEDLGINILIRRKGVYDYDVRGKKGREKMFPMVIRRRRTDDFGDLIRPEDYLRAEERDEVDGHDIRGAAKLENQDTLGKKRKWDDSHSGKSNNAKRSHMDHNGDALEANGILGSNSAAIGPDDDDDDYEPEVEISGPSKIEHTMEKLPVDFRLAYVDFSGLHDKRSLQMLIPLIQPRKLVLVGGMREETQALEKDCRTLLAAQSGISDETSIDVYTPNIGMTIDASVDTHAWIVKLSDNLVKRLRWQSVKNLGIVTLTGRLEAPESVADESSESNSNKRQKLLEESPEGANHEQRLVNGSQPATSLPQLDIVPTSLASATRSAAQPLHVGDLRLADLRKMMQSAGHTAEFRGEGTLLIDGFVAVRKTGTGRIEVEGNGLVGYQDRMPRQGGETFFAVKRKIYEGLAVVAGG